MPAIEGRRWTAAEVRALPEEPGKHYEVIDGELFVSPGPSTAHQRVAFELQRLLDAHLRHPRTAYVLAGPGEVEADPFTLVQPDVFVVGPENGRCPEDVTSATDIHLIAEVLSPTSGRRDRVKKRQLYQRMGVEYWIVDPEARLVERWMPQDARPEVLDAQLKWSGSDVGGPLDIDLAELFAESLDR
jgi:Uma2 family endonuclease